MRRQLLQVNDVCLSSCPYCSSTVMHSVHNRWAMMYRRKMIGEIHEGLNGCVNNQYPYQCPEACCYCSDHSDWTKAKCRSLFSCFCVASECNISYCILYLYLLHCIV